jgi:hypothetical protein
MASGIHSNHSMGLRQPRRQISPKLAIEADGMQQQYERPGAAFLERKHPNILSVRTVAEVITL